jgi:serine/threonine-protein kinase
MLASLASNEVILTDFGITRLGEHSQTRTGVTLGPPEYLAPERYSGSEIGSPADDYTLAATLV